MWKHVWVASIVDLGVFINNLGAKFFHRVSEHIFPFFAQLHFLYFLYKLIKNLKIRSTRLYYDIQGQNLS